MTAEELIAVLEEMPQNLPVLVEWEGTLNLVEQVKLDADVRIIERTELGRRIIVGAVVIDGEHRVDIAHGEVL